MARKKSITVDDLWRCERLGALSLSPDGAQAVCAVGRHSMADNKGASTLWLLSTLGGRPRPLTHCGEKDGQPRFSPQGDRIGFVAKREQQGKKDEQAQFYVIAPDGGEAQRVGEVATGVEAFKWCPNGRQVVLVSWVWPELKGAKAQAKALKAHKDRKETGYATDEALYRYWDHFVPMGRVPHLHLLDVASGKLRDLFEGGGYELARTEPDAASFDISPDGRKCVFAHDPSPDKRIDGRYALAEVDLRNGRITPIARDAEWTFGAPRYSPDGTRIAFIASHQGRKHTAPDQLAIWERGNGWALVSAEWDHEVHAPLLWEDDGQALLLTAEQQGRRHLWRFDLPDRRAEVIVPGGTVNAFDKAAGTLVTLAEAADHPVRAHAHLPGQKPRRIEQFNDALLKPLDLGSHEETWVTGAQGDPVQVWVFYPPGFDPKKKYPLLQVIHGGPHTAVGDNWHYRWNNKVFASEGYVVAVVNYHGSSSFGYAFKDSITHRWGELELQDVEAATDALLKKRYIDRKRVYATGGSYGGFMVAWMNGHVKPGRYKAYVCHAGCFDWTAMFADDAWSWHAKELGAWYWDDLAKVNAQSPHAFAAAMKTPTLVIHGALDYRVPDQQGLAYYNTLKALGVDARLLWFPDENHWVLKPRNSALWYREFFGWLKKYA
ncbi:MAG: S9 family peptidase [Burkholderiales bacterium]|nr:S9 family peptidase [Burkholderiales bacterium]